MDTSMGVIASTLLVIALASPTPQPVTSATPHPHASAAPGSVNAAIEARALEWFYRFQSGNIDRSQLDARSNRELTASMIAQESATLKPFGKPTHFVFVTSARVQGAIGYTFGLSFPRGRIIEEIAFDPDGKIAGVDFMTFVPSGQ